ncbi:MAG: AAA family ATPase [Acidobacteria bacterium]|nr:AAA family ATPase [Acidobacteriota bacterium]
MGIEAQAVAIGLTGPFGSGCTTDARILQERLAYKHYRLSDLLVARWRAENPEKPYSRTDLQLLGNHVREDAGDPGVLAREAIAALERDAEQHARIAFDGIRNTGEIDVLRNRFGHRFFLFAIECPREQRWKRLEPTYMQRGRTRPDFLDEEQRDGGEEGRYGQQVRLCVFQADVLLRNDDTVPEADLRSKLYGYVGLVTGEQPRYAKPIEILMNLAYSAAHGSKCLKRQVGAVLVDARPGKLGQVVGQGFNENPSPTHPCVEEPRYGAEPTRKVPGRCFRDIVRYDSFVQLSRASRRCPQCGEVLTAPASDVPPWRCRACRVDLEDFFWPERAMTLCTAIHAEVAAMMAAGWRAKGTTLYSTTFPCFQCAEKIVQTGIKYVVYTEPYPDVRAAERLEDHVEVLPFEGVRSGRFDEIFYRARRSITGQT